MKYDITFMKYDFTFMKYDFTTENMTLLLQMGRYYVIVLCTANTTSLHKYDCTNANVTYYLDYDFTI